MNKKVVSVVKYEKPLVSVKKAIELVDGFERLPKDGKIFIKPNLVYWNRHCDFPKWGMLTTSRVVEDIIKLLKERGVNDISIGDGIISDDPKDKETPKDAFEKLGYNLLKERYNIKIYDLFSRPYEKVELAEGVTAKMNSDMNGKEPNGFFLLKRTGMILSNHPRATRLNMGVIAHGL